MNRHRTTMTAFGFLALLACLPACAKKETPGLTDKEIVLGTSAPLTGPAALWGNVTRGMEAYVQYVNESGGVHGRTLRLIAKDDQYNPGRAVANMREMADQVFAIVGLLGTAVISACRDQLAEKGIPMISPFGNVRIWTEVPPAKRAGVFVMYPDYTEEGRYLARFAAEELGSKTLAVFYQNDDYGKSGLAGVEQGVKESAGASLVAQIPYEVGSGELSTQAQKLKEAKADAVILYPTPKHGAMIVKEMAKLGYRPKLLASFPLGDPIMFTLAAELWEGAHVALGARFPGLDPQADQQFEIALKYNPDLKSYPNFVTYGVNALRLTVEGLKRAGPKPTREGFIKAMESIEGWAEGGMFPVSFGPQRRHGMNSVAVARAEGGKYVLVKERVDFPPLF
ncbi:MAG: ABC transporter substrate-binding protein [Nitrospirae bacterium]|nr:ABC transporter substrate-binding protein [Nitrospirota bacterium]